MADNQTNSADPSQTEPLSLKAFAASLYHAERADNYFSFLNYDLLAMIHRDAYII